VRTGDASDQAGELARPLLRPCGRTIKEGFLRKLPQRRSRLRDKFARAYTRRPGNLYEGGFYGLPAVRWR